MNPVLHTNMRFYRYSKYAMEKHSVYRIQPEVREGIQGLHWVVEYYDCSHEEL